MNREPRTPSLGEPALTARGFRWRASIPTRIFLGFVWVLAGFGVLALLSLAQHQRSAETLRLLNEGYLPLALTVGEVRATQAVFGTFLDRLSQEEDSTATRNWLNAARRVRQSTLRKATAGVERAVRLDPKEADSALLREVGGELHQVGRVYAENDAEYDALFGDYPKKDREQTFASLNGLRRREQMAERRLRYAWNRLQAQIASISQLASDQERRSVAFFAVLGALALGVGAVVMLWARRVLSPLPRLQARVAAVGRGEFGPRLSLGTDDELGRLADEFERMVDALSARDASLREAGEAQRRLQRLQEQILTSLRAAVIVVDGSGIVRSANPASSTLFGVGADAIGSPLESTGLLERLPVIAACMSEVRASGVGTVHEATPLRGPGDLHVDLNVTPFGGTSGIDGGRAVLIVAEDVTEDLRTKSRMIHTERLAAIGRMAAHVTHEVRNPLSSIGLNVEMLEEEIGNSDEARALLRAVRREIDRLTNITEEYLRVVRLPAPHLDAEDLGDLARSVALFVGPEMRAANVDLDVHVEPRIPLVRVDEPQVRQAILNLVRNAREAMSEGGRVVLEVCADQGGVAVRVRDEGPGVPVEERGRIFELFYTTKERGTGLGLPLTQQIVAAHGGRVRCLDSPGRGTIFELWFPVRPRPADDEEANEVRREERWTSQG